LGEPLFDKLQATLQKQFFPSMLFRVLNMEVVSMVQQNAALRTTMHSMKKMEK
jgi:hypothetical protein